MAKKFLDYMSFKPKYVVEYQEKDGTYDLVISTDQYIKNVSEGRDQNIILGYAASKSHPNDPVIVKITITPSTPNAGKNSTVKYQNVLVHKCDGVERILYTSEHDLYVYEDKQYAVFAGNEMRLLNKVFNFKIDDIKDGCQNVRKYVSQLLDIAQNANLQDKLDDFMDIVNDYYNSAKNQVETFTKDSDKFKKTYNDAKETVKSGVSKLVDELKKNVKHENPYWCENEQCALYRELTKDYAVLLKHHKNFTGSKFTITIFKLNLGEDKIYTITQEMFHDIYNILNANEDGRLTFNSIMDVIADVVNDDIKQSDTKKDVEKPAKTNPIQMVEFRPQDTVKSEPRFVNKFKVGDKVVVKTGSLKGTHGVIDEIIRHRCDSGTKTKYLVRFGSKLNVHVSNYKEFYSYQLDKYVEPKKEYTTPVTKPVVKIVNDAITDIHTDLNKKIQEHDEVINKIWNFLNDLKDNK